MFVVLEGTINIYIGDEEHEFEPVIDLTHHQFTGELNLLNDEGSLVNARTTVDSVLLRLTRAGLQRLMRAEGEVANLIMQAFIWRRIGLAHSRAGVVLIGNEEDAETLKLQRFLRRNGYPHRLVSEQAYESSLAGNPGSAGQGAWPAVAFDDGRLLHRPSVAGLPTSSASPSCRMPPQPTTLPLWAPDPQVARRLYMPHRRVSAPWSSRASLPADRRAPVPKSRTISAFPRESQGQRLAHRAWVQALKFGVRFAISREAVAIERHSDWHKITLEGGLSFVSRAVVIATGAQYRKLHWRTSRSSRIRAFTYAATGMEAQFCRSKEVVVVGGGNSAGQAALFLSQHAAHVYLMIRGKSLAATMSEYLLARIEKSPRISILTETELVSLDGGRTSATSNLGQSPRRIDNI